MCSCDPGSESVATGGAGLSLGPEMEFSRDGVWGREAVRVLSDSPGRNEDGMRGGDSSSFVPTCNQGVVGGLETLSVTSGTFFLENHPFFLSYSISTILSRLKSGSYTDPKPHQPQEKSQSRRTHTPPAHQNNPRWRLVKTSGHAPRHGHVECVAP